MDGQPLLRAIHGPVAVFEAMSNAADKTEKATPKKREDARKKGQVGRSTEVSSLFVLVGGFGVLAISGGALVGKMGDAVRDSLLAAGRPRLDANGVEGMATSTLQAVVALSLPVMIGCGVAGLLASVVQVKPGFFPDALKPKFGRINPIAGTKKLASPHSMVELVKNLLKLTIVGGVGAVTVWPRMDEMIGLSQVDPASAAATIGSICLSLAWRCILALVVITAADVAWSRYSFSKGLKMSKDEVKQESKQQDMPQEVRGQIRSKARQMARARMLGDVQHADVVLTNPTHFAVALQYRKGEYAPRVVAKGADLLALRIRELAREHGVALVEDPPLAREIYRTCEVGRAISADLFGAVAEVLAFVYRTSRRRRDSAWV